MELNQKRRGVSNYGQQLPLKKLMLWKLAQFCFFPLTNCKES